MDDTYHLVIDVLTPRLSSETNIRSMEKLKALFAQAKENAKFLGKHLTSFTGAFFLFLAGEKVNKENYGKRVLILFGGGVGDVVIGSVACGYLKEYLNEYDNILFDAL